MNICAKCRKEMKCVKTGATVHFRHGHTYSGDAYECPECGARIIIGCDHPYHTEDHWAVDFYLEMHPRED